MTTTCNRAYGLFLEWASAGEVTISGSHIETCPDCRSAANDAHRFSAELDAAVRAMAAAPLPRDARPRGDVRMLDRVVAPMALGMIVVAVAVAVAGMSILKGDGEVDPGSAPGLTSISDEAVHGAVVAMVGAPPAQIVRTQDGVAALAVDDDSLDLVLVRAGSNGIEALHLAAMPLELEAGAAITAGTIIACPGLGLLRDRFAMGYVQPASPMTLEGLSGAGGSGPGGTYLFALDGGSVRGRYLRVFGNGGKVEFPAKWLDGPEQLGQRTPAGCFIHP